MAFNRKIWTKWRIRKPCPTCLDGTLEPPSVGHILKNETSNSNHRNSFGGDSHSEYIVSMHLRCNNCEESVAFTCLLTEENYPSDEQVGIQKYVTPISFYPAPKIIAIPKSCPKSVKEVLDDTFKLYWVDLSSCANKIRTAIEILLNDFNVPTKTISNKGGEHALTLGNRIQEFEKTNLEVAKILEAIKLIGNAGSHLTQVSKEDVLDAYQLLEFALDKLYVDRTTEINILSQTVKQNERLRRK